MEKVHLFVSLFIASAEETSSVRVLYSWATPQSQKTLFSRKGLLRLSGATGLQ